LYDPSAIVFLLPQTKGSGSVAVSNYAVNHLFNQFDNLKHYA